MGDVFLAPSSSLKPRHGRHMGSQRLWPHPACVESDQWGVKITIWPAALGVRHRLTGEMHSPVNRDKEFPREVTDSVLAKRRHLFAVREVRPAPK